MVKAAKDKVRKKELSDEINFIQGNALSLPFGEDYFDVTAMAFGIRNISQREKALKEMLRHITILPIPS